MKRPIITLEDGVEVLKTTGDVDATTRGGGVLFRPPDRRDIFWTFWSPREVGEKFYRVFTAPIPVDIIEYYNPEIKELMHISGLREVELRSLSRSKNPSDRLELVMMIQECGGSSRVDPNHEPELLSIYDLHSRWGRVFGINPEKVPMLDGEDFILRESGDQYECGSVDGKYLGKFQDYRSALCAIANFMKKTHREQSNVFHEHSKGQLELIAWDYEGFSGILPEKRGKLSDMHWRIAMKKYVRSDRSKEYPSTRGNSIRSRKREAARLSQANRLERAKAIRGLAEA